MEQMLKIISEIISKATTLSGITTVATTTGTIFFAKKLIEGLSSKTKLVKKNIIDDFKLIDKAPEITQINKLKSNIENEPEIREIVSHFTNTLGSHLTSDQMQTVYKNIQTLQYQKLNLTDKIRFFMRGIGGSYQGEHHSIVAGFSPDKEHLRHILYHELIHASTSSNTTENSFCGFAQKNKNTNQEIGRAINEGYTELLTRRYFGEGSKNGYGYEVAVAKTIEFIVGEDKMKESFFKLDLRSLITELGKYSDINKATQFISNLDSALKLGNSKQNDGTRQSLAYFYNQVNIFLYDAFSKKAQQSPDTNRYSEESNKFQQLLSEITNNNKFNEEKNNKKDFRTQISSTKEFIRSLRQNQTTINEQQSQQHEQLQQHEQQHYPQQPQYTNQKSKPKTLIKIKPSDTSTNNRYGFVDIITFLFLLIITTTLSIGLSYLILQARK